MAIKDFEYYHNLHTLVTNSLLHLLNHVASSTCFVPTPARNNILVTYLKPKLREKVLNNIKKDIKLMIKTARTRGANLEIKLYQLNDKANQCTMAGAENLYSLLVHLNNERGLESRLFDETKETEENIIYLLEEHLEHCFEGQNQIAPISLLTQLPSAPELIEEINITPWFYAEMKEWNENTHQAHILVHPAK